MEKHDHRHKEELLQQMRRQAEIRPEQNDSEPAASSDTGTFKIRLALAGVLLLTIILSIKKANALPGSPWIRCCIMSPM